MSEKVLMILPHKVIYRQSPLLEGWTLQTENEADIVLQTQQGQAGRARLGQGSEFGRVRSRLELELADMQPGAMEALVSAAALSYDKTPCKYPLYWVLDMDNLEWIGRASRMGWIPYFGTWSEKNEDQSVEDWQIITDNLKRKWPEGM